MNNRWQLILGSEGDAEEVLLSAEEKQIEDLLKTAYGQGKQGGFGKSVHKIRKWLDGIRTHFSHEVVSVIQQDVLERQNAKEMLLEPELLEKIEPDIKLVSTILSLQHLLPEATRTVARNLVAKLVRKIEEQLKTKLITSVRNGLAGQSKKVSPQSANIDWRKTIGRNIKYYDTTLKSIIPNKWYGFKKGHKLKEVILLLDKSESMIDSTIYASIIGSVLASLSSIKTHIVFFDTEISDVTGKYQDPIDIIFSVPIGGGTDIGLGLRYINQILNRHSEALVFLISDLDEGGSIEELENSIEMLISKGTHLQCVLALNYEGKTEYNGKVAELFSSYKIPVYSASPEKFPEILCCELEKL